MSEVTTVTYLELTIIYQNLSYIERLMDDDSLSNSLISANILSTCFVGSNLYAWGYKIPIHSNFKTYSACGDDFIVIKKLL